jgi:hypothetical protein
MKDAIKEENEILDLPTNLHISAFEKMLHRLLAGIKYSVASHDNIIVQSVMLNLFLSLGKEKAAMSNNVFTSTSIDEEQEFQVSYLSRTIKNNHHKYYALYTI